MVSQVAQHPGIVWLPLVVDSSLSEHPLQPLSPYSQLVRTTAQTEINFNIVKFLALASSRNFRLVSFGLLWCLPFDCTLSTEVR